MVFHVDLDAFFASIEQRDNPALAGKPIIVGGPGKDRGVVAAASYPARKFGIHSGMPLFKAVRLCPHIILVPPNFRKYSAASHDFYEILSSFTPYIQEVSIDEAILSFYGFEAYYENFVKVAQCIQKKIYKKLGITASIGIGTNKTIAKIASNYQKPNGITFVEKGREKIFLSPLPIGDMPGIGRKTEEKLQQMEIRTIGQLSHMAKPTLSILFGKYGTSLWEAANGHGDTKISMHWDRKSLGAETTFLHDSDNEEFLKQTLYFLAIRIGEDLREEGKIARGIALKLRTNTFYTTTHQERLPIPTDSTIGIYNEAKKLLYASWNRITPLRLIGISTFDFDNQAIQQLLFSKPKKLDRLNKTLDRIRTKFGFWSIMPGSLLSYPQKTTSRGLERAGLHVE